MCSSTLWTRNRIAVYTHWTIREVVSAKWIQAFRCDECDFDEIASVEFEIGALDFGYFFPGEFAVVEFEFGEFDDGKFDSDSGTTTVRAPYV